MKTQLTHVVNAVALAALIWAGSAAAAAPGQAIYERTCIACHGADGNGALPGVPKLGGRNGRLAKSDDVLIKNMIEGFQSPGSPMGMPAKGGDPSLTDADFAAVLQYMRETFGR